MNSLVEPVDGEIAEEPLDKQSDNIDQLSEISKNSRTTFFALILACVYSYLTIAATSDGALLSNSSTTPLPIIQVNVRIVWFYYFAPIILTVLFIYFHLYLERFWRCIIHLPLYHPDGRRLDDYVYPWLISSLFIRGELPQLANNRLWVRLESGLSLLLGWWLIPLVLLFYWARYLVTHDWVGTLLHSLLVLITVGLTFRFFYSAKNALRSMLNNFESDNSLPLTGEVLELNRKQILTTVIAVFIFGVAFLYLSLSSFQGLPADKCSRFEVESSCRYYNFGARLFSLFGIQTFTDIGEGKLVEKPDNWQDLLSQPEALRLYLENHGNLTLLNRNLQQLNAQRAFLPASRLDKSELDYAELQHAVMTGSTLVDVSLIGANIANIDLQYAIISNTQFDNVEADVSRFDHARFRNEGEGEPTRFSGAYYDAWFEYIDGDNLRFEAANLRETHFSGAKIHYSMFHDVDLAGAIFDDVELVDNEFIKADFSNAQISNADLSYSIFDGCTFISTNMKDVYFEDAELTNTVFDHTEAIAEGSKTTSGPQEFNVPRNLLDRLIGLGMKIKKSTINNTHFKNAELRFASFESVKFSNTLFSDTDLSGAIFKDTNLSKVDFNNVDFSGADLEQSTGLTQQHLQESCGNKDTKLPSELNISPC